MRKVILLATLIACFASASFAQDRARPEFFTGFSVNSIDTGLGNLGVANAGNRETAYGFETSGTGYFNKNFGLEGNFDAHFKSKTFTVLGVNLKTHISTFNFMGGPHVRLSNNTESKVTPFVHALFGGNHSRASVDNNALTGSSFTASRTDFAIKLGGGVDFKLSPRTALRLSADYNPIFERDSNNATTGTNGHRTRNDAVFSVGIVIK